MSKHNPSIKTFVTCFTQKHYEVYAKNMLDTVLRNWKSQNVRLIAYYDGFYGKPDFPRADFIEYRNLDLNADRSAFLQRNADKNGLSPEGQYNYNFDGVRFCHKVFAYCDMAEQLISENDKGWLVWLDADTLTTRAFDDQALEEIFPDDADVVHLGRISIDYSETGFVGWNLASDQARLFLSDIKNAYVTDEVFKYVRWHDSFVFERLLNIYKHHGLKAHNLSPNVIGLEVFQNSVLKEYFVHNKGLQKFEGKRKSLK